MNAPLIAAGSLAVIGAAIHGAGGELLVVRKLSREILPSTRFGGRGMTLAMIHVTWHVTTLAFLSVAVGLLLAGTVVNDVAAEAIALLCAGAFTGFALVALALGSIYNRSARSFLHHPGPIVMGLTAALAWWGAL